MMEAVDAQMALLPTAVHIWVNWMMAIFAASVIFLKNHREARFTLAAFAGAIPVAFIVFHLWGNIHLFGIAHLATWAPLLIYLTYQYRSIKQDKYKSWNPFRIWVTLLMVTISISLLFDLRDIYLVIEGGKAIH